MLRRIYPLALLIAIGLILAACNIIGTSTETPANLLANTPNPQLVTIQLNAQADTSVPFTTVGQNINFKYEVKNIGSMGVTGTVTISGATATCPAVNTVGNLDASLDPNEPLNCTGVYPITQADLDKGSVSFVNTASINGINSAPITITVPLQKSGSLTLTTTANPLTYDQAGRQIIFTYVIKNSGTTPIGPAQFTISDSLISTAPFNCGDINTTLAPAATVTCPATYTVSQTDASALSITSIATASGGGVGPSPATNTTVTKSTVPQSNPANLVAGTTISHTVIDGDWIWQIARCYGADPNKVVEVNSQLANPAQIKPGMIITVPNIGSRGTIYGTPCVVKHTVKAGETWTSIAQQYNADPSILQIANSNTLTVGDEISIPRNSAGTLGASTKALSLTITANPTSYDQVGQQISYTYVIKNSGTTSLGPDQFKVTDSLISATAFNCGNAGTTLASNATVTCTATYTITQADLNAVSITNLATASGGGAGQSPTATFTINKGLKALTLTTTPSSATYEQAGQQITYTYVIKNNGATTIGPAQFTITDTPVSPTPLNCGAATSLAPNATVTCTAIYTITQADMAAVSVTNIATAAGGGVGPSQNATSTINKAAKALSITTTANPTTYNQAGQQITFTYVIKNSGNVTLGPAQFTVTDVLIGPTAINCADANVTLAPNATINCTAVYTITQADMGAVSITNVATASGAGVGPSSPASVTVNKQ